MRGELNLLPNSQQGGGSLEGSLYLEGVARKEVGDLLQGVVVFYLKNKLKSEIFNVKKSL